MAESFERWAEKNGAARSALSVITWLDIMEALDEHNAEAYMAEEAGELKLYELPPCPICGTKAFLHSDTIDGNWMGWSIGCPRYSLSDDAHGAKTREEARELDLARDGFYSKTAAVSWWLVRCAKNNS